MEITKTKIEGCYIIKSPVFSDERGHFLSPYLRDKINDVLGEEPIWVQDNQSYSKRGVIRGIHYQKEPYAQAKLVRCAYGLVKDIIVDLRKDSLTFGKHVSVYLSSKNGLSAYIPRGCGHGFSTLSDESVFDYKVDNYWNKESESGIIYNDETLAIDWEVTNEIVSNKDKLLPKFSV